MISDLFRVFSSLLPLLTSSSSLLRPIVFLAIVGKKNEPLVLRSYNEEEDWVDLQLFTYAALDYFEDKVRIQIRSAGGAGA